MRVTLEYGTAGLDVTIPADERDGAGATLRARPAGRSTRRFVDAARAPLGVGAAPRPASGAPIAWRSSFPTSPGRCRAIGCCRGCSRELSHVPAERITIVIGTGSHRATTDAEIRSLVGESIATTYAVVNHDAFDPAKLARAGIGKDGHEVFLNRAYVEADRRIVLGFVEPHFMAGFSGGYKGIFPGVADIASIMRYHDARMIGDPRSTWGLLDGNPTQERIRHDGALLPVDFCVNVTLNRRREITAVFCGDVTAVHDAGCAFSRETAMVACDRRAADRRDHQQRLSARSEPLSDGEGHVGRRAGRRRRRLHRHRRALQRRVSATRQLQAAAVRARLAAVAPRHDHDAGLLAVRPVAGAAARRGSCIKARVGLHSELPADDVRRAHLEPVEDVERALAAELTRIGRDAPVAVLPEGPMTIPYVRG